MIILDGVFKKVSKNEVGQRLNITVNDWMVLSGTISNVTNDIVFIDCEGDTVVLQYWKKPRFTEHTGDDYPN